MIDSPTTMKTYLPIPSSRTRRGASWLRFRSDLVIAKRPHEHFLIHGLSGIVEHRRDARRAADFRALPRNDDQRRGRFLIAQNRHTQRLSSWDGDQLRVFVCLCLCRRFTRAFCLCLFTPSLGLFYVWLCFFRLYLRCLSVCLRFFRLSTHSCRLSLRHSGTGGVFGPGLFICHRNACCQQQHDQQVSAHGFSFRLSRLRRSAIHLAASVSFGTSRLYAS